MSDFLGAESFLVPLGASIGDAYNTIKTALTSRGYQFFSETTGATYIGHCIPPVSEVIGNSYARDVLRIEVSGAEIKFTAVHQGLVDTPQVYLLAEKTAGAVTAGVTIGGVLVEQGPATVNAGNTAAKNLRYLYDALRLSVDATVSSFDYEFSYPAKQNGDDALHYIIMTRKTSEADITITPNTNVNGLLLASYKTARIQNEIALNPGRSVTIDLVNGFVYYLQVCSRGIALATKTNVALYGPIHAAWSDHSAAIANMPTIWDARWITPVELFVGWDDSSNESDSHGIPAKGWILPNGFHYSATGTNNNTGHPLGRCFIRHKFMDVACSGYEYTYFEQELLGSAMFVTSGTDRTANDFQAHRISASGYTVSNGWRGGSQNPDDMAIVIVPPCITSDWYKFTGTATDESLLLVADTVNRTKLAATIMHDATPSSIEVQDGSLFQNAGFIVIGSEIIEYTSKSGNVLSGITRSKYASWKTSHFQNDEVSQGLWFVKIGGGLLFFGYQRPS